MAHILMVDDNADLLQALLDPLESAGHRVTLAGNGNAALKVVRSSAIDLMITDLIMPGKEGLETILEVRREFPAIKIIAMSGDTALETRNILHIAQLFGADGILTKPFSGKTLVEAVHAALDSGSR